MTDPEFDDFAKLWQQSFTADEQQAFRALARRVSLRTRLLRHADIGIGLLLIVAIAVALAIQPAPAALAVGILTMAGIGWSSWKRHVLARLGGQAAAPDRRAVVEAAAANVREDLRRSNLGLLLFFPGVLLGALLNHSVKHGTLRGVDGALWRSVTDPFWGLLVLLLIIATFLGFVRGNLRLRKEAVRLGHLEAEYREEARLDRSG